MISEKLMELRLPELLSFEDSSFISVNSLADRQTEIKALLQSEIYGVMPNKAAIEFERISSDEHAFADKAVRSLYRLSFPSLDGFSFPVNVVFPKDAENPPLFVFLNFRKDIPDMYYPAEEIVDNGFAVASVCYTDVTSDDGDFTNGLAGSLKIERLKPDAPGKIALWAWAASAALDLLERLGGYDKNHVAVMGHSRLGKTALVSGAFDKRFNYVFSNDSGCGGAALTRQKTGENVEAICSRFGYWFCPAYQSYVGREDAMPFDQHFLLALSAPRHILVSSAAEDLWADPYAEFLCCAAVSPFYERLCGEGFVCPDRLPEPGDAFLDGRVGYQLRAGSHYLSRYDWQKYMAFMQKSI